MAFLCHLTFSLTHSCICLANPSPLRCVQARKREQLDISEVQAREQAERLLQSAGFCRYQDGELVKNDACFYTSESWQLTAQAMGVEVVGCRGEQKPPRSERVECPLAHDGNQQRRMWEMDGEAHVQTAVTTICILAIYHFFVELFMDL
ncbi:hypothetical protein ILYODFUR_017634 [Ilyodon furcidens]|uniref:Uncharacterized protein n=1 Tax=Ilyodon furcidens TaxID=33524 RepID=A0ABV0TVI7_9TELE